MDKRKLVLPVLLPVQILLINVLSHFPDVVERFYSNGIYIGISNFLRIILGWIPFSVGDIFYGMLLVALVRWIYKKRKIWRSTWKSIVLEILGFCSIFYFFFHFLWALNYIRVPISDKMSIQTEYTDAELLQFTERLIAKVNSLHLDITANKNQKVVVDYSHDEIFKMNFDGYSNLAKKYPFFEYRHQSCKPSLISLPLSYMGFSGYLNPFTNEAQVNYFLPAHTFPATAAHEMAHQIGFASESEANFVGFLATTENTDLKIQYSGYTMALNYCMFNWSVRNELIFDQLKGKINPGVLENYKESREFWEQYESVIETVFEIFYDNFLKANQQEDGIDSYSRFVDLLVNYYKNKPL